MTSDKTIDQVPYTVLNFMGPSLSKVATGESTRSQEIPSFYGTRFHKLVEKILLSGFILNEINSIDILMRVS